MKTLICSNRVTLLALLMLPVARVDAAATDDTVDVDQVIASYHEAVVTHDAERLVALFVPEGSAWFSALTDDALQLARAKNPSAAKLRPWSVKAFAAMVASRASQLDPRHSDLKIWQDGTIAAVTFRFSFVIDGHEANRGSESWHLIKGSDGWRIVSVIYSSDPIPAKEQP